MSLRIRLEKAEIRLLIEAAQFAIEPETLPVFLAWRAREPGTEARSADEIMQGLASAAAAITALAVFERGLTQ